VHLLSAPCSEQDTISSRLWIGSGLVRFGRTGPEQGPNPADWLDCFQSWSATDWLFGSAWPGIYLEPVPISSFSFWPRINPHLVVLPATRLVVSDTTTRCGGGRVGVARCRRGGVRWRRGDVTRLRRPAPRRRPPPSPR
jgi:hypothetical protein